MLYKAILLVLPLLFLNSAAAQDDLKEFVAPEGYVVQELGAIRGKILRPKDWFYNEQFQKTTLIYKIAREDIRKGGAVETGLTINVVFDVKKLSELTPSEYADIYIKDKLKSSSLVSKEEARKEGKLMRKGVLVDETRKLPTETKDYRIGYTFYCHDEADVLIVMIFGTPASAWKEVEPIQQTMMAKVMFADFKTPADAKKEPSAKTGDGGTKAPE
jgi:hypothetical protein